MIYLVKRACCQLASEDAPQVPIDPLMFMLASHSMMHAKYDLWGPGIPFIERVMAELFVLFIACFFFYEYVFDVIGNMILFTIYMPCLYV